MNHRHTPPKEPWEQDRVWELIDQSRPPTPSGHFVNDTVRAARLSSQDKAGNGRSWAWGSLTAGLLGATAALVIGLLPETTVTTPNPVTVEISPSAREIQEIAETETLIAAVEHMEEFSDRELVTLIGF